MNPKWVKLVSRVIIGLSFKKEPKNKTKNKKKKTKQKKTKQKNRNPLRCYL